MNSGPAESDNATPRPRLRRQAGQKSERKRRSYVVPRGEIYVTPTSRQATVNQ